MKLLENYYKNCTLCPRNCKVDRSVKTGVCGCKDVLKAARAGLHLYEEPYLSGVNGSGTVFFTGCSLGCVYCQNGQISKNNYGFDISVERLAEIFLEQQSRKAHNINLVTGTHYTPSIAKALKIARDNGLSIPVVWNSSGYEKADTLRLLEGLVDIFMPDFKTLSPDLGKRYMKAPDYPAYVKEALACMVEMTGETVFEPIDNIPENANTLNEQVNAAGINKADKNHGCSSEYDEEYAGENVLLKKGVVVRHLIIPGQIDDSKDVVEYLYETYGDKIWISLMSQYTPLGIFSSKDKMIAEASETPELFRTLSAKEYDQVVDFAIELGVENCMIQEGETASDSFIPIFDGIGIK